MDMRLVIAISAKRPVPAKFSTMKTPAAASMPSYRRSACSGKQGHADNDTSADNEFQERVEIIHRLDCFSREGKIFRPARGPGVDFPPLPFHGEKGWSANL